MDTITVTAAELEPEAPYTLSDFLDAPISVTDKQIQNHRADIPVTDRQLKFAMEYIANGGNNASAAKACKLSPKVTEMWVGDTLAESTMPELWKIIDRAKKRRLTHLDVTRERVLTELSRIAFFDPKTMYDESGRLLAVPDMPEDTRRAIAGVDVSVLSSGVEITKIKIADKTKSLQQLATILGINKETLVLEHKFADLLQEIQHNAPSDPLVIDLVNDDDPMVISVPPAKQKSKKVPA